MFKVEISILGSAWKQIHTVGNVHAAEVFAGKRTGKNIAVRIVDTVFGNIVAVF